MLLNGCFAINFFCIIKNVIGKNLYEEKTEKLLFFIDGTVND